MHVLLVLLILAAVLEENGASDDVWRPKPKHSFQYTVVMDTSVMTIGGLLEAADGDLGLCGKLLYRRSTRYCYKKDKTVRVKRCSHLCSGPLDRQLQDCKNRCPIYLLCMYGMKGQNDTLCQRFFDYQKPQTAGGDDAEDGHVRNLEVTTYATGPAEIDDSNTVLGFLDVPEECRAGMRRSLMIFISVQITSCTVIFVLFLVIAKRVVKGKEGFMRSNLSHGSSLQWNDSEESIIYKEHQNVYTINKDGAVADEADDVGSDGNEKEEDFEARNIEVNDSKTTLDFTEEDCLILDKTITSDRNTDSHTKEAEIERKLREVE